MRAFAVLCFSLPVLAACAAPARSLKDTAPLFAYVDQPGLLARTAVRRDLERDRQAILSMAGEYEVDFKFEETVVLQSAYQRQDAYRSAGYETVVVVADDGHFLSLQHLLVSKDGAHVTKHWRQDWHYMADERLEFSEVKTWRMRPLAQRQGVWTQCVYEVNDAPRYCGSGAWQHGAQASTWTSDHSWRPLPRREYTRRDDYNALRVINRHTITASGWTHEQDNTKLKREGEALDHAIAREVGFNDYRRIDGFDFRPAYDYWARTQDYWRRVREQWQNRIAMGQGIALNTAISGMELIVPLFQQAEQVRRGEEISDETLDATFSRWTRQPRQTLAHTGNAQLD